MPDDYEMPQDTAAQPLEAEGQATSEPGSQSEASAKQVQRILTRIRADKRYFDKAFERMQASMFMALHGRDKDWAEDNYKANVVGQHIRTKTAALYAKNPKIVSTRKDKLDFVVWDESPQTLMAAMQTVAAGQQVLQAAMMAPEAAPVSLFGHNGGPPLEPAQPAMPAGYEEAVAIVQDFEQGMQRRKLLKQFGRTLELLFADAMTEQTPLDFKTSMKRMVRRSLTTGVGYVELGFQREYGVPNSVNDQLADYRGRIQHVERLMKEAAEGEIDELDAEMAELKSALAALEDQDQVIIRSGLTFTFHPASKVIPDKLCMSVPGFVGCRHLTVATPYTKAEVEEKYGCDLGDKYTPYTPDGKRSNGERGVDYGTDDTSGVFAASGEDSDLVCLFRHFDKTSGLVYHLVDGHPNFLQEPAAPDVTVPRFWPIYALSFNETESESEPFPKSDVEQMADMQKEINRSRQGKREHRDAARPRWAYAHGVFGEDDLALMAKARPFQSVGLKGLGGDFDIRKSLQAMPVPGVDPNLYDTGEVTQDLAFTVGAQAAQLGGVSTKTTATGVAVASNTMSATDSSSIDDLDSLLTMMSRDGGQILMANMSKEEVVRAVGPGAVWVEDLGMTPEDIYREMYLKVEAGSTGKPNQADEIRNFKDMAPLLLQTGAIPPEKLAREGIRRLDDRLDLTDMIVPGTPAIVAMNRQAQVAQGDPQRDPSSQGGEGDDKTSTPSGPSGSSAPIGNNHGPAV